MSGLGFEDGVTHATDLSANFYTHFQTAKNDISARLEVLDASGSKAPVGGGELNSISSEIVKLRKDLVDATPYLPTYDRGRCEQQLKALEESLSRHRVPKSKFAFKRKAPTPAAPSSVSPVSPPAHASPNHASTSSPSTTNLTLSSHTSAHLTLSSLVFPAHAPPSDITLTDLRDCIVDLFPSPGAGTALTITALHARALHRVVLVAPPIEGSVLLHDVRDSIVVVGCHQFRMHDSTNTTVLLHALSTPIIEGSHTIQFGAYPDFLRTSDYSNFFPRPSQHAQAQDFDWIKPSASPHWSLVASPGKDEALERVVKRVRDGTEGERVEGLLEGILPGG